MKLNLKIQENEAIAEGADDNFLAKFMEGTKGKVKVNTPFGKRELKLVKKFKPKPKKAVKKK